MFSAPEFTVVLFNCMEWKKNWYEADISRQQYWQQQYLIASGNFAVADHNILQNLKRHSLKT